MIKINKLLNHLEGSCNEYLARKILKDISSWKDIDLVKISYLNRLDLIDFPNILSYFYTFLNKSLQEDLVKLILLSRSSTEMDLACSNAATILAKSDFIFKDLDFSRIRIPKADLSQRLFVDINFEGSYLKEVNFVQSQFKNVNFKNCDLSSANFGYFKKLTSEKGKGFKFSFDDKYFWYKNDDSIIEIDTINPNIKNEFNLINFFTTNISRIHSLRFKPSSTTVHGQYIKLWDNYEKSLIYKINIYRVVISPNLKFIAALDVNSTVLSWDLDKMKQFLGTSNTFTYRGGRLLFTPSNGCLAIIRTKSISFIETQTWTLCRKIWGNFPVKNISTISYCCKKIAFVYFDKIYLLDAITSSKTIIYSLSYNKLRCLSFSPCGKFLAFGIKENYGFIIDIKSHQIFQIFTGFESYPISVTFSNSGKYISWSDYKGNIRIYEFSPKFCQNDKNRHLKISSTKISPKGTYLITSSTKNSILWDLNNFNPKQIKEFMGYSTSVYFVFSPHETYLLKRSWNKIEIYDIKRDFLIKVLPLPSTCSRIYSFTYCENYLICLNKDNYEYYRIPDFQIVKNVGLKHLNLTHMNFSDCGNYDFWYDSQSAIYIWDLLKDNLMKKIQLNQYHYWRAATPLLSKIATYNTKEKIGFIDVLDSETGEVNRISTGEDYFYSWCFTDSSGTTLVGGFGKGVCKVWDVSSKSLKQQFRSLFLRNIDWIVAVNGHIIIRENDNVEIFTLA